MAFKQRVSRANRAGKIIGCGILPALAFLFFILTVPSATAGYKADAISAYKAGDLAAAVTGFKKAMENGEIPQTDAWKTYITNLEKNSMKKTDYYAQQRGMGADAWVLLGSDAVLSGLAACFVVAQNNSVDTYESMKAGLDNTTEANYWRLLYEREKTDAAGERATYACAAAGVAVLYTAIDLLFLHNVFPVNVKPVQNGVAAGVNSSF
jgi:hypothetical protein